MSDAEKLFDENLLLEFLIDFAENNEPKNFPLENLIGIGNNSEIQRMKLIIRLLNEECGYEEVTKQLIQNKYRVLYSRTPYEFVLIFCFKYNDNNIKKKYNLKKYFRLIDNLGIKIKGIKNRELPCTLKALERIIKDNSVKIDQNTSATKCYTQYITSMLDAIDYKSKDAVDQLRIAYEKEKSNMANAQESARYYIAKYCYYIIIEQILEFRKIVFDLRHKLSNNEETDEDPDVKQEIQQLQEEFVDIYANNIIIDQERMYFTFMEQWAFEYNDLKSSTTHNLKPRILSAASKVFAIQASFLQSKTTFLLSEQTPNGSFDVMVYDSNVRNNKRKVTKSQKDFWDRFNNNPISCFDEFQIDYSRLFELMFFHINSVVVSSTLQKNLHEVKKNYLQNILTGEADFSRNALIWFLISAKLILNDCKLLSEYHSDDMICFNERHDKLSQGRINSILVRCGYDVLASTIPQQSFETIENLRELLKKEYRLQDDINEIILYYFSIVNVMKSGNVDLIIEMLADFYENRSLEGILDFDITYFIAKNTYHNMNYIKNTQQEDGNI